MVVDNLAAHKPQRVRELIEERGCEFALFAFLLAGVQPHRRSVLQDQEVSGRDRS